MDFPTKVNLALTIVSTVLAIISVLTVIITIRQNHKMIESSTRPYICIYGEAINPGSPMFYIVIKNFGASPAVMTKFVSSFDFTGSYSFPTDRNFLEIMSKATIAPGQSRICRLDYDKIPDEITFSLEYLSGQKRYSEKFTVNIKAGAEMVTSKVDTKDKELRTISYSLQEMLQKSL